MGKKSREKRERRIYGEPHPLPQKPKVEASPNLVLNISDVLLDIAMAKFRDDFPDQVWDHASTETQKEYIEAAQPIFEKIWNR
jgi:hypothetical protein